MASKRKTAKRKPQKPSRDLLPVVDLMPKSKS